MTEDTRMILLAISKLDDKIDGLVMDGGISRSAQDLIRDELIKCSGASEMAINGIGSDGGPLELTLAEIGQAFAWRNDAPLRPSALWALHVIGPDDIIAFPSRKRALLAAAALERLRDGSPPAWGEVIEWPFDPEHHAARIEEGGWKEFAQLADWGLGD